jgi:hypothetical protein
MNTIFLLMARYDGRVVIPFDVVRRDFFSHLTPSKLIAKLSSGEIPLPLIRIEKSQKSAKGVHVQDLANYIDERAEAARKEMNALTSARASQSSTDKAVLECS